MVIPMADENSWRTPAFRQSVVTKIDEAIRQSGMNTSRNSIEMESHVFLKAKNKEEYLGFVARLILHVREMKPKQGGGMAGPGQNQVVPGMPDPINALQNLASQGNRNQMINMGPQPGQMGGPQQPTATNLLQTLNRGPGQQMMMQVPMPMQRNTVESRGWANNREINFRPPSKLVDIKSLRNMNMERIKKPNICGAERKRRKKARFLLEAGIIQNHNRGTNRGASLNTRSQSKNVSVDTFPIMRGSAKGASLIGNGHRQGVLGKKTPFNQGSAQDGSLIGNGQRKGVPGRKTPISQVTPKGVGQKKKELWGKTSELSGKKVQGISGEKMQGISEVQEEVPEGKIQGSHSGAADPGTSCSIVQSDTEHINKEARDNALQLVITCEDQPDLAFTKEQLSEFLNAAGEVIANTIPSNGPLQFNSTSLKEGQIIVNAANEASKEWLLKEVGNIRPWKNIILVAKEYVLFPPVKAIVWLPGKTKLSNHCILRTLARQNPGLLCSRWRVLARVEESDSIRLVLRMDRHSIRILEGLQMQLYFSTTRGKVTVPCSDPEGKKK